MLVVTSVPNAPSTINAISPHDHASGPLAKRSLLLFSSHTPCIYTTE